MSREDIVAVKSVVKVYRFGKVAYEALRGVTMSVDRSEVVCVVGPSGSGKTTLLNIIGGLDKPDTGTVTVEGTDITRLSEAELTRFRLFKVGYVFQLYNLIPTLTVLENVELPMYLAGVPKEARRKRALELLEIVGLEKHADKTPDILSGGEQQRVAIARALANSPAVVLMDEPTGALDTENTRKLMALVKKLNRELRQTFIIATHDILVARECTKTFTIRDGRIEGVYSPSELSKVLFV
ncbi:MAG: ABC transporter ATP-binding protein [Desulfurococcaceae archaeon]|nr:ABC transporter ATP-binding protein [Desulfurococcaceae archaeon]